MKPGNMIAADLRTLVRGTVLDDAAPLAHYASDNGALLRRMPAAVVRPKGTDDVSCVLMYARSRGIPVATRSGGHSLSGQTLSTGIVLDMGAMRQMAPLDPESTIFDVEPGLAWRELVGASLPHGLVPPVLTGTLRTTVGGTHAVGGLGHASLRRGAQVDNCVALEIVTTDGEVHWCSAEQNAPLFLHSLAGLGQLGVVTRVRGRLRRHEAVARSHVLLYRERSRMLADMRHLAANGLADEMGGYGMRVRGKWLYTLDLMLECATEAEATRRDVRDALHFDWERETGDRPFAEYVLRGDGAPGADPRNIAPVGGNPWIDALMPESTVELYCRQMMAELPTALLDRCTLLFWPMDERKLTRPMFRSPRDCPVTLTSIFPTVPYAELAAAAARMTAASDRLTALGGKRYLYGWVQLDAAGWQAHFGDAWPTLCALKERYDPEHILNPGFIRYAASPTPALVEALA